MNKPQRMCFSSFPVQSIVCKHFHLLHQFWGFVDLNTAAEVQWKSFVSVQLGVIFVSRTIRKMPGSPRRNLSPNRVKLLGPAHEALTLIELWCEIKLGRYIKLCRCPSVAL